MSRFHFKQFSLAHDRSSMKVGTDGILIGAWAAEDTTPRRVLDIGTGCGIIALMLAQRFPNAEVVAIERDTRSAQQAQENFAASPWAERIAAVHSTLQDYSPDGCFDLIVSNPPWFQNSLKPPDAVRASARHDDWLSTEELLDRGERLLSTDGRLCCILPIEQEQHVCDVAKARGLFVQRRCRIRPRPEKDPHRAMLAFATSESSVKETELAIEVERHFPTPEYRTLTSEFLLKH